MSDKEIQLLQEKLEFAEKSSQQLIERYFEQERKIRDLNKQIANADVERDKAVERAVKDTKFTVEKDTVQKVCDIIDDCIGQAVFEYTDKVRKSYKIPTKYGYEE